MRSYSRPNPNPIHHDEYYDYADHDHDDYHDHGYDRENRVPNIAAIRTAIRSDRGLTPNEQALVEKKLQNEAFTQKLLYGGAGAGLGLLIGKFLMLSPTARILVSLAGFGLGKAILTHSKNDKEPGLQYNDNTRMYELK